MTQGLNPSQCILYFYNIGSHQTKRGFEIVVGNILDLDSFIEYL